MRRLPDLLALLGLGLATLIFFWPLTFGRGWVPAGGGDLVSFLWPTYSYAAQSLWSGRLPLWNPTLYAGAPFIADNQSGVFYPFNLLTFLLAPGLPYPALEWLVAFHFWFAGVGLYVFMRLWLPPGSTRWAALFAALAYMFSEVFITHIGNLNIVAVAAWLPWAFAVWHQAWQAFATHHYQAAITYGLLTGGCVGLAALAGHAQMTLVLAGALGLYGLWRWAQAALALRGLLLLALPFAIAFGLSALSVLPAIELTQYTARARLDYAAAAEYSLPWAGLAGLVSPLIFGRGAASFWGPWARVELGYLGVLPLFFAGLALAKTKFGQVAFFWALAVLGVLIALGEHTPFHQLLYTFIPGFAQLRVPARFILLTDFALAVLGGLGLAQLAVFSWRQTALWGGALALGSGLLMALAFGLTPNNTAHLPAFFWGLGIGLLLCGLAVLLTWPRLRQFSAAGAALVLAVDLIGHGAWVEVEFNDPTQGFNHPAVVAFLRAQPGPIRIDNVAGAWSPDAAARFGLEDISGISNPLALATYATYLNSVGPRGSARYNFLNAQFVIADKNRPPADASFIPVFNEDPQLDVYLNTNAGQRVSLVYSATVVADGEAAFGALFASGFDPATSVIAQGLAQPLPTPLTATGASNLYYLDYRPEAFSLIALTPGPAYLVLSEVWYPGWRAWVNGVETPIFKANFAFRGLALPSVGEHHIEMRFEPMTWYVGLSLTIFTWLLLYAYAVWVWRSRRNA